MIIPRKPRLIFSLLHLWPSQRQAEARYDPSSLFLGSHTCALWNGMCIKHDDMRIEFLDTSPFSIDDKDTSVKTAGRQRMLED